MNVTFSRSLSGFNREEVIEYIRKLTSEKVRAEDAARESAEKLESSEDYIEKLQKDLKASFDNAEELETQIAEKDSEISQLKDKIYQLEEQLQAAEDEKTRALYPIRVKVGGAEADLRSMAEELSQIAQRAEEAHAFVYEAVTGIDEYTSGVKADGNI